MLAIYLYGIFYCLEIIIYIMKKVEVVEHLLYIVAYHDHDHLIALEVLSCTYRAG